MGKKPTEIVAARGVAGLGLNRELVKQKVAERLMFERQFLGDQIELEIQDDEVRQVLQAIVDDAPRYKIDRATAAKIRAALRREAKQRSTP